MELEIDVVSAAEPFKDFFESLVSNPRGVGIFLLLTAFVLWFTELYSKKHPRDNKLTWKKALLIGLFQGFAVTPGLSRSGSTIAAGLLCGMDRVKSARYSFLLSTPIVFAATLYKFKDFVFDLPFVVGVLASFIVGLLVIKFLLKYLQKGSFKIFAIYRVIFGIFLIAYIFLH